MLLRRFPLRSAGGEQPQQVEVGAGGVAGDRAWSVVATATGRPQRPGEHPRLAGLEASVDGGRLVVRVGGVPLAGRTLAATTDAVDPVLTTAAGTSVSVEPSPVEEGRAPVHVISEHAERDPAAPTDCDLGHRANVVLRLDGASPGAERTWVGRRLRVGGAELALTRTPRRCLGVYADVVVPGPVTVGDEAVLLDHPGRVGAAG